MEEKNQMPMGKVEALQPKSGAVGLDIGTSRIVAADSSDGKAARTELNAFVAVPASDMIEQVLFTTPGERVNRPGFGSGILQTVFACRLAPHLLLLLPPADPSPLSVLHSTLF